MKILLTGGSGFIGRYILSILEKESFEVHALTRDINKISKELKNAPNIFWHQLNIADHNLVNEKIRHLKPETCIHLAWDTMPGRYLDDIDINLNLLNDSLHLLKSLVENKCSQFIALGTCAEYQLSDTDLFEDSQASPETIYAASKSSLYLLGKQITKNSATKFCWGRLFFLYGPGENKNRLVPALLTSLHQNIEFKASSGEQWRDYLYVKDVALALFYLLKNQAEGAYNICSNEAVQVKDILLNAQNLMKKQNLIKLGSLATRAWDPPYLVGNNQRLKSLGWSPQWNLTRGLLETIDCFSMKTCDE
ncbi:MAG: NAD(P)-dependent oxidoreductase [Oligoflexales bacterium]|nr:NAD(P)-dependent oxidoreductase [Oligoflexales bacterium]